jgi:hypothetical protein
MFASILATAALTLAPATAGAADTSGERRAPRLTIRANELVKGEGPVWTGTIRSPQLGRGTLILRGPVRFRDEPDSDPEPSRIRLRAQFKRGTLGICMINRVFLRPGNRQVWDGVGRVEGTPARWRRYRGLRLELTGVTSADEPTRVAPLSLGTTSRTGSC